MNANVFRVWNRDTWAVQCPDKNGPISVFWAEIRWETWVTKSFFYCDRIKKYLQYLSFKLSLLVQISNFGL